MTFKFCCKIRIPAETFKVHVPQRDHALTRHYQKVCSEWEMCLNTPEKCVL